MPRFRRPLIPRRRRLARLRRPRQPQSPATRKALKQLQRAHEFMGMGEYAEAAAIFEELAVKAERISLHRTPQLFLQAGRAWIASGKLDQGFDVLIKALQSMANLGQFQRLPKAARRVLDNLRAKGLDEIASSFEEKADAILTAHNLSMASEIDSMNETRLPAKCSSCGGTVHPEEVEWSGTHFAACGYCGSKLEIEA